MATQPGRSANEIDYRITLGAYVNARLQMNPKAFRIPCNNGSTSIIVRDFLDARGLRRAGRADRRGQRAVANCSSYNGDPEFRTSYSCNVDPQNRDGAEGWRTRSPP